MELDLKFRTPEEVFHDKVPVSDIERFTSSSAPISCFDPVRKMIFTPYHAAYREFGEQASVFALAAIPVPGVDRASSSVLLESDVTFQGKSYNWPIDAFSILYNGSPRIFFLAGADNYYCFDWSPEKSAIEGGIRQVLCKTDENSQQQPLTTEAVEAYLKANNCDCDRCSLRGASKEHIICTAKPSWNGSGFYGMITSSLSYPILFRCRDGMTFEFCGVIPALAKYECQTAVLNGKIYALLRGASGDEFWEADEGEWQFRPCGRLGMSETRPQLMRYDDSLLLAYSRSGVLPNRIRDGRNNITILAGNSEKLSEYETVFQAVDEMGIVYYDIVNCNGDLYMIWSNSERFPDKIVRGVLQGKDTLYGSLLATKK
ncbi:MAG: hypothetical protein IJH79_06730 [Lentisphaeria bacterium]|nr:hypothetical protein [Lentisphaeria bacterium]